MKNKIMAAIMVCVLAIALCGCMKKQNAEPVTITLMHGWNGSGIDHAAMRGIYDDFQRQNPDINLLFDAYPDVNIVIEKAQDMLAVDKMPNIISTNGYSGIVHSAIKKELALDLSPYISADADFASNISPFVLKSWQNSDGSIYTIPDAFENMGYWYNEDLMRQAGITVDGTPNSEVKLPSTWDEFWAACRALSMAEPISGAKALHLQPGQLRILLGACLAANNGVARSVMQHSGAACTTQEAAQAVNELLRAIEYSEQTTSILDTWQLFFEGKSAIYINGVWSNTELLQTQKKQNIRYAPFPSATGETVAYVSPPSGYVVSASCTDEQKNAAVRFIKYMISEEVQKRIVLETKQAPSSPKITTEWIKEVSPILGQAIDVCYTADVQIVSLYVVYSEKANREMDTCWENMFKGIDNTQELISIITDKSALS